MLFRSRRAILSRAKELRKSREFRQVFVAKDLTHEERERDRKLREELKEKRQQGESVIIRNGEIIHVRENFIRVDPANQERSVRPKDKFFQRERREKGEASSLL